MCTRTDTPFGIRDKQWVGALFILINMLLCCIIGPADDTKPSVPTAGISNEALCLTLPGNPLDLSALLKNKKFKGKRGNKEGALRSMRILEDAGLGKLKEKNTKGSLQVRLVYICWYTSACMGCFSIAIPTAFRMAVSCHV